MTTAITDIMVEAKADLIEEMAETGLATFTPATGDPIENCHVDIRKDINYAVNDTRGQVWNTGTVLEYLLSETGRIVAVGETFTEGGNTWTVQKILTNDGRFSKVVVK